MKKQKNSKDLDAKVNEIDPTLSERSYEPIRGHNWKWTTKTFRSEKGFRVFNSLSYSMTQIPGSEVYGECKPPSEEIDMDITKSEYESTLYHEDRHVIGDNEYLARFHTSNYSMAA